MKRLTLIILALFAVHAFAGQSSDLNNELDALGANKDLMKKAKAIDPYNRVRVVQNRDVDRNMRFELGVSYGAYAAGTDSYFSTQAASGQLEFHIDPHWSLGARYTTYSNQLNNEGRAVLNDANSAMAANGAANVRIPSLTYASNSYLGTASFYPIYGKMNLFDQTVSQFDLYVIAGAGGINTNMGSAPLYTAGGGVALWLTNHFGTRLEGRWQGYTEKVYDASASLGTQQMNEFVLQATLSFLL